MRKLRKLVLTAAALAALAVGGAAFAQAQSAGTVAKVTVQHQGETSAPGDTDGVQSGDQGSQAGEQESGEESQAEAPDSASERDGPDGHHDESAGAGAAHESEGN